jgi:hypothetical protein
LEYIISDKRRQFQKSSNECTVSLELLWRWHGDSSRTQEGDCPVLKACTRGLVKDSRLGKFIASRSELRRVRTRVKNVNCNYDLEESNKSSYKSKLHAFIVTSPLDCDTIFMV